MQIEAENPKNIDVAPAAEVDDESPLSPQILGLKAPGSAENPKNMEVAPAESFQLTLWQRDKDFYHVIDAPFVYWPEWRIAKWHYTMK